MAAPRSVLLAGASGLVGRELLAGLLADTSVGWVHALVRRDLGLSHAKLTQHHTDFSTLPAVPPVDEAYLALGTTIKAAGSQAAFRAVDYEANLAVARMALGQCAMNLGVVSAMGANAVSRVFYNRVKGELEEALSASGFATLVIARPSLLVGDRAVLGQPSRSGEALALRLGTLLRPVVPANLRPIAAADVAAALLRAVPRAAAGTLVLSSGQMQGAAAAAQR